MSYFTATVEYTVQNGESVTLVKQTYLVDAVSVTDAEAKIYEFLPDNYKEKHCKSVTTSNVAELITIGKKHDTYFMVRIGFPHETSKGIKHKYSYAMINGEDVYDAINNVKKFYKHIDHKLHSLSMSNIICDEKLVPLKLAFNVDETDEPTE